MENATPLDLARQNCVDVFLQGHQNWKTLSLLEKIEFAYKSMEAIRDYMCIENSLGPASMGVFFQTLDGGTFKNSGLRTDLPNGFQSAINIGILTALTPPQNLFFTVAHEIGHNIDIYQSYLQSNGLPFNSISQNLMQNLTANERNFILQAQRDKCGFKFYGKTEHGAPLNWMGSPDEYSADTYAYTFLNNILQQAQQQAGEIVVPSELVNFYKDKAQKTLGQRQECFNSLLTTYREEIEPTGETQDFARFFNKAPENNSEQSSNNQQVENGFDKQAKTFHQEITGITLDQIREVAEVHPETFLNPVSAEVMAAKAEHSGEGEFSPIAVVKENNLAAVEMIKAELPVLSAATDISAEP